MTTMERVKAIAGAAVLDTKKDIELTYLQKDFLLHFADSTDYEPDTLINGVSVPLIVWGSEKETKKKSLRAKPGVGLPLGGVVDCYNSKWIITGLEPNDEFCPKGQMELCNKQLIWQNPDTLEIIKRWSIVSRSYHSDISESNERAVSQRQFDITVQYDSETAQLDNDKRFMLEVISGKARTYKITCVNSLTDCYQINGKYQGFIKFTVEQDQYNSDIDNIDLMICNYKAPSSQADALQQNDYSLKISYSGNPELKMGGSSKLFTASIVSDSGDYSNTSLVWSIDCLNDILPYVHTETNGNIFKVKVLDGAIEGASVKVILQDENKTHSTNVLCKVVSLF